MNAYQTRCQPGLSSEYLRTREQGQRVVRALKSLAILAASALIVEVSIIVFFFFEPGDLSTLYRTLFRGSLLIAALSPLLYFLAYRPPVAKIAQRRDHDRERGKSAHWPFDRIGLNGDGQGGREKNHMNQLQLADQEQADELFKTLADSSPIGVYVLQDGRFQFANQQFLRQTGYEEKELLDADSFGLVYPEDKDMVRENAISMLHGQRVAPYEYRVLDKDGRMRWVMETVVSIQYKGRRAVMGNFMDVTERKEAETQVRQSEQRFRTLFENSPFGIVITRDLKILYTNSAYQRMFGYEVSELLGKSLLDLNTPECSEPLRSGTAKAAYAENRNFKGIRTGLRKDGTTFPYEVESSKIELADGQAVIGFVTDITERTRAEKNLQESLEKLGKTLEGTIQVMALTVEMKDPYTAGHQQRVARLAVAISREMGLTNDQIDAVRTASILHDIGKINVPAEILSKPGVLGSIEFSLIKAHAEMGYNVLKTIEFPWPIANIVLQHHERLDGSGYPSGLTGNDILIEARILAVADVVEAMASHRPYRPSLGIDKALDEISRNSGILYDSSAVTACLRLFTQKGFELEDYDGQGQDTATTPDHCIALMTA